MQAYLNDATLKTNMLKQMRQHETADMIVKGTYGEQNGHWRGCAIGCALHSLNLLHDSTAYTGQHSRFPAELGIPLELAYLIDHIFEQLPEAQSRTFPRRVLTAIAPGADLSTVLPAMLQWSILHRRYGWLVFAKTPEQRQIVHRFAATVARDSCGETVSNSEWDALDVDLDTIPAWAWAWAWAWAGAGAKAWAGAGAKAWAWAWAWAGAKDEWYIALSAKFIQQLRAAK